MGVATRCWGLVGVAAWWAEFGEGGAAREAAEEDSWMGQRLARRAGEGSVQQRTLGAPVCAAARPPCPRPRRGGTRAAVGRSARPPISIPISILELIRRLSKQCRKKGKRGIAGSAARASEGEPPSFPPSPPFNDATAGRGTAARASQPQLHPGRSGATQSFPTAPVPPLSPRGPRGHQWAPPLPKRRSPRRAARAHLVDGAMGRGAECRQKANHGAGQGTGRSPPNREGRGTQQWGARS